MEEPSDQLVSLLERLRLATGGQVRSHRSQVRRLAGELGFFDSVWIDALAQARLLTPFQAREINTGRGAQLAVGPFVLARPQGSLGYAECFDARHIESSAAVRLYVIGKTHPARETVQRELVELTERCAAVAHEGLLTINTTGADAERIWAATTPCGGRSAGDWMVENGRFPALVLPIAQTMTTALVELTAHGVVHGDISAASLLIHDGRVVLAHPGLRGVLRPGEGYAHHDLFPAAYDYLAPERIAEGTPPTVASDLYACGALWWHLLTGRPPFAGGNSLAKLQAVHAARVVDVRRLAPDTPQRLADAITCCLAHEPNTRPAGFEQLAELLGPSPRHAARRLARLFSDRNRTRSLLGVNPEGPASAARNAPRTLAAVAAVALIAVVCWPAWRRGDLLPRWSIGRAKASTQHQAMALASAQREAALAPADASSAAGQTSSTARASEGAATPVAYWSQQQAPPLVLPADRPLDLERLSLRAGQLVRGEPGTRPKVVVPARGLSVAVEDVTFENIDFVSVPPDTAATTPVASAGMIAVSAARAQFQGCTFHGVAAAGSGEATTGGHRSAIAWRGPARGRQAATEGSGQLALRNCVIVGLPSAIEVAGAPRFSIALANSLFADCGAVVRLRRTTTRDPSGDLLLEHVTARETGPVVLLECEQTAGDGGLLNIAAIESTFAPRSGAPLLVISSETPLDSRLEGIEWQGQGSLLTSVTPVAAWQTPDGKLVPIPDEQLSVAGLVRSAVQFAGKSAADSGASRTVRWQVPLQSAEPPGIGDDLP